MQNRYPIRAAAKITGISLDTLRAWERRYGAVTPERSDRGRQYSSAQIERLLVLNQLVQKGHAIGGIAALGDRELKDLLATAPGPQPRQPEAHADLVAPILLAIENFDSVGAGNELSRLAAVLSPRDVVYQVVLPLMAEVGIRWRRGAFAVSQEHLISQILRNLLGGMMRLFQPNVRTPKIVLSTPAGEAHEFGILAAAMLLSIAGIGVVYLGSNLPAHEIAEAALRVSAGVIVLGITIHAEATAGEVRSLAAAMPVGAELWVGGAGSAGIDLANLGRKIIPLTDLAALENEGRRWRDAHR